VVEGYGGEGGGEVEGLGQRGFLETHRHLRSSYRFRFLGTDDRSAYRVEMGGVKTCMNLDFIRQTWCGESPPPPLPEKIPVGDHEQPLDGSTTPPSSTDTTTTTTTGRTREKKVKRKRINRAKVNAIILSDLAGDLDRLPLPGKHLGFTKDCCIHRVFGADLMEALPESSYFSYNRRGGVIEIANAWLLFMNFGVGKFYKKYTNKFLLGGRQLTFTMPSNHAFFQCRTDASSDDDGDAMEATTGVVGYNFKPILLFIRGSTKEKFFFCGDCKYVTHTGIEDGDRADLILEVLQFDKIQRDDDQIGYLDIVTAHSSE